MEELTIKKPYKRRFLSILHTQKFNHRHARSNVPKYEEGLHKASTELSKSHERIRILNQERKLFNSQINTLTKAIENQLNQFPVSWQSAVKIQRAFRAHQTRRNQDKKCIKLLDEDVSQQLTTLKKDSFQLNFHKGIMSTKAGQILTKNAKKWLFGRKIQRISHAYYVHCHQRMFICFAFIRNIIHCLLAKQKVKRKQFKIYRSKRLREIRTNLAIIVIRNLWRKLELTVPIMKKRFTRFNRRAYEEDEDPYQNIDTDSASELMRIKEEEEFRHKLNMSKVSYNIPRSLSPVFLDFLESKPTSESPIPREYRHLTRRLFDEQGKPVFLPRKSKPLLKSNNKELVTKKNNRFPGYLKPTLSSEGPVVEPINLSQPPKQRKRLEFNVLKPTMSYIIKKNKKFVHKYEHPVWSRSTLPASSYTPALENSNYIPTFTSPESNHNSKSSISYPQKSKKNLQFKVPSKPYDTQARSPETTVPTYSLTLDKALPDLVAILQKYKMPINVKARSSVLKRNT